MVLRGAQRGERSVKAEISRLWSPSLNTQSLTSGCVTCVAFVLGRGVSLGSTVLENEVQLERCYICLWLRIHRYIYNKLFITLLQSMFHISIDSSQRCFFPHCCTKVWSENDSDLGFSYLMRKITFKGSDASYIFLCMTSTSFPHIMLYSFLHSIDVLQRKPTIFLFSWPHSNWTKQSADRYAWYT